MVNVFDTRWFDDRDKSSALLGLQHLGKPDSRHRSATLCPLASDSDVLSPLIQMSHPDVSWIRVLAQLDMIALCNDARPHVCMYYGF